MRRLLRGCESIPFAEADAHRVGALLAKSRTADIVDAAVVALAVDRSADIQTSDSADIRHLAAATRTKLVLMDV